MRILLVDDHPLIRDGLRAVLRRMLPEGNITEAETAAQALDLATTFSPELVILDLSLPGMSGLELIRRLRAMRSQARLLVITGLADGWTVRQALDLGANGYLVKTNTTTHLLAAITAVCQGERFLCPDAKEALEEAGEIKPAVPESPGPTELSTRELDILKRIAQGYTTKDIALMCDLSTKTIETHRQNIMRRLHLENAQDLTRYAIRHGLIVA